MSALTLLTFVLAATPLELACSGVDAGAGAFTDILKEAQGIIAWQRRDSVAAWLNEHGLDAERCPALLALAAPASIEFTVGTLTLTWRPDSADEPLCFSAVEVRGGRITDLITLPHRFCLAAPPEAKQEDFNFDGRADVRLVAPLSMSQSRRFDLVLLATADGHMRFSAELSELDSVEVDPRRKMLSHRVVDPTTQVSTRKPLAWRAGRLVVFP